MQDVDGYLLRFQQDVEDWSFGADKQTADELFDLVVCGKKTATSSLSNEKSKDEMGFSILTNFDKTRRAIICTTKTYITKFNKVNSQHAFKEGEKDRTLKSWRIVLKGFFEMELKKKNLRFNENCDIDCEEFEFVKLIGEENANS